MGLSDLANSHHYSSGGKDITETTVSFRDLLPHVSTNIFSGVITTQGCTQSILNICPAWTEHASAFYSLNMSNFCIYFCALQHAAALSLSCDFSCLTSKGIKLSSSKCHDSLRGRHTFPLVSGMYTSLFCPFQG